eukprot:TRINITY_DN1863_c0_g1_i1.p1 TRINITY_DN1863_c0_g1~~TRINITY_DN1863_c0_g1_i1.p1  ORF type:complete len:831 (+),score=166.30 TRINITY_DN1863_c0_g1_i1:168-2660(+)
MSEQVRRLPPTPPVAPLKVPPHDTNVGAASPKLRSTQSLISPRGTLNSPGGKNPELSRIATLVGTFAAMEQQNSAPGSPHPNQPPVPTKKAPPIPNRPKSVTLDHGVINAPLSPNSNTPKVAAKGPLPKRPSHAPPPPPKSVNGAPVASANSNNEDESSASDSINSDRSLGPSSDGNIAGNLSPRRKNAQSEANIKRPLVRKTTGPPRVFQSRVQNALAAAEKNDRRASDDTVSPRSAGNSPNLDRKSRRMSISGLTSPRARGGSNESPITSSTDVILPPKAASEMHSIDLETATKKRKLSVSSASLSPDDSKGTKRSSKAFVKGLFAKVSESVKRTHSKTKGDSEKDRTDKDKSSNNTDDVSAQEEEIETFEDPLAQMSEEDWITQKRPKREWPVVDAATVPKDYTCMVDPRCTTLGYYIEFGQKGATTTPHLEIEYGDLDIFFYRDLMCSGEHVNFVGESAEGEPPGAVVISVEKAEKSKKNERLKCIIRTKRGHERTILEVPEGKSAVKTLNNIAELSTVKLSKVRNPQLQELLVDMERKELIMYGNYKFGVLYWRDGLTEDEMFAQTVGSADYEEFLAWLGDRIKLFGWDKYRGGLDTKNKSTGEYSVYKEVLGKEIMFHVSTLLPSQEQDVQRVERKRHIGNDVVVIIFKEGKQPFDPLILTNQFNHIFAIVEKIPGSSPTKYKLVIVNKVGTVPSFPELPFPPVFEKTDAFRQFLLTKLINAERAAMQSPEFKGKMMRTRKEELSNIVAKSREMKDKKEQPSLDTILGGVKDLISKATKNVNDKIEKRDSKKLSGGNSEISISTPQFVQHKPVSFDPTTNSLTQ